MINQNYDKQIKEWIEKNHKWIINDWISLAKIPAILSEPQKGAPYGSECAKALEASAELFRKKGFEAKVYESGYALANFGHGNKTVGLFSHSDVVPVGDDWIYTEPFEPVVKNNTLIGRGVSDNKSGIMASLCVFMMARDLNFPMKKRLQAFIGSNEECGMEDIEAFVKEQPMPDFSFVPDGEFPGSIGEKGIYHYWALCGDKLKSIKEFKGGEAFNIVIDKVNVKISYSDELFKEISEKILHNSSFKLNCDSEFIYICAKGVAKHASEPDGSLNAAYMVSDMLSECNSLDDIDREIMTFTARLTKSGFGEGIGLLHEDDNFGKLTMVNGMADIEDGCLKLSFDTRYGSQISGDEVESRTIQAFEESGWVVQKDMNSEGFYISAESDAAKMIQSVYNEITGKNEKLICMGGGTYARHLKNAVSIGTEEGKPNGFEMPDGHGGPHQCDEMIDIDGFFEAVRILMHFILEYQEID